MGNVAPTASRKVELAELRAHVADALAGLPQEMREVIALRFEGDLEYREIAAVMACSPGLVASRLHRGLKRLGQLLRARGLTEEAL
jgi:RNA polymerase sigma factor (sigma-70 family)